MTARVRFAPSPTGYLHLGVARTALFNWIYARSVGGVLILRVEDTDEERSRPEIIHDIIELTNWLGIDFDEGPYFQSERKEEHRQAVAQLLAEGKAYLCDSENQEVAGDEITEGLAVRFRIPAAVVHTDTPPPAPSTPSTPSTSPTPPTEPPHTTPAPQEIRFTDEVRGEVSFNKSDLEDFVIWRSNNTPTFLLSNAVDDAAMEITHAIRGEDLLSSTPKIILLFEALGHTPPTYAHLPLLVNESRQKLSKRRDDVSLQDWRDRGYLPEAMANYLALLGWGPPDNVEIRPMAEIIKLFDLEGVVSSPAFFDSKKLEHFNATYIRDLGVDEFIERAEPWLTQAPWPPERFDAAQFRAIAPHIQEKIRTMSDIPRFVDWLFLEDPEVDLEALRSAPTGVEILTQALVVYESVDWEPAAIHAVTKQLGEGVELSLGKAQMPIRVAITGRKVGPPLFEAMVLLEREEVLRRLERGIQLIRAT